MKKRMATFVVVMVFGVIFFGLHGGMANAQTLTDLYCSPMSSDIVVGDSVECYAVAYDEEWNEMLYLTYTWESAFGAPITPLRGTRYVTYTATQVGDDTITVSTGGKSASATIHVHSKLGPYPNGMLLKPPDNDTVYLIEAGKYRGFMSAEAFQSYGYSWDNVVVANPIPLFPAGNYMSEIRAGTPIKGSGPGIYITAPGDDYNFRRCWGVGSKAVFDELGLRLQDIVVLSNYEMEQYTPYGTIGDATYHPQGMLVKKAGDPTVYVVEKDGTAPALQVIPSWTSFVSNGYDQAKIITISETEFGRYADYPDSLPIRNGTLVKASGAAVYAIDYIDNQSIKRLITSAARFEELGFKWQNIYTIPDSELAMYTLGDPVN